MRYILILFFTVWSFILKSQVRLDDFETIKKNEFSQAIDLSSYLPKGYSISGDKDYTKYLQKGLDENLIVCMPNFPILVNSNGIKLRSNQKVLFQPNSKLVLIGNNLERYSILEIYNVSNVKVYFPKIQGDKHYHLSSSGQWGMGLSIIKSSNIFIQQPNIESCWGDGIYLGNKDGKNVENVTILGGVISDSRRNGISITSANNVLIKDVYIKNTGGQSPEAGIDIEPNSSNYLLKNINLVNINTENNKGYGVVISTGLYSGSRNRFSINIDGLKDIRSDIGLAFILTKGNFSRYRENISGTITINNFYSANNRKAKFRNFSGQSHSVDLRGDFYKTLQSVDFPKEMLMNNIKINKSFIVK
ncbi:MULTISPECIES: right-handed parallel beta-helix repeat-containing protein [unclassified Sphingobacterium]|uniref:right-handed parallel beta-helix repeat-containing protein n=1 Tax=unclassified Sphingobacterium TaxID=2609468 RepID=UPI0025EDD7D0|nr:MULTISPECIES: right-handed parallel beta-helix repeat-containing protein [unclassified Sphingobacterium]